MLDGLRPARLVGLAVVPGPLRRPLSFARPLRSPGDYRGTRIGIRASEASAEIFRALGATPVLVPRTNDTTGLGGVEAHVRNGDTTFGEPGATLTGNVVFEPRPTVIFVNRRAFEALSPAERRVLVAAGAETRAATAVFESDGLLGSLRDLCRRGLRIVAASPADLAGLRAAVQPVYDALDSNPATRAYIREIASTRRGAGDSTDAVTCTPAGRTSRVSTGGSQLQGAWEVTYTRKQLDAAGASSGEDNPADGNHGHFTFTFDRGHWSDIGPRPGKVSGAGTYVVTGHTIYFHRTDHAYPGSDTEVWGPYTWGVYRDTLAFAKQGSSEMPTGLVVKPWRGGQVGRPPDRG